ncbi:MAG: hemin ABC transporter substrate-binding protein [Gammaproteobacteria bacterium]|nr:MAG: hemin ABC transporter substrate-binding protein [Gammaproteobacteria bacterium]
MMSARLLLCSASIALLLPLAAQGDEPLVSTSLAHCSDIAAEGKPGKEKSGEEKAIDTSRVVVAGSAITESLYRLGLEQTIVAVDTTSQWPPEATELPSVGYLRSLASEGLLSLEPSLMLLAADAGPPETIEQLERTGIAVFQMPRDYSVDGVTATITSLGCLFGVQDKADTLNEEVLAAVAEAKEAIPADGPVPRVLSLLGTDSNSVMAAGAGTAADAMIRLAGGENVLDNVQGYKPLNAESLATTKPDVIIASLHGEGNADDALRSLLTIPGVAATPAAENARIHLVEPVRMLGFGPRIAEALHELVTLFYPAATTK